MSNITKKLFVNGACDIASKKTYPAKYDGGEPAHRIEMEVMGSTVPCYIDSDIYEQIMLGETYVLSSELVEKNGLRLRNPNFELLKEK
jgi:hypothetical protein